jgi:hypothetical protein
LSGSVSVGYFTSDGTATVFNQDYSPRSGRLDFAPGDGSKSIIVPVNNDTQFEGDETFNLGLNNPSNGVAVGAPNSTVITITDDDVSPNPIDGAEFFVRQHYSDFLNRAPDPAGLAFWINQITSCGTDQGCIEARRINVSASFFLSIEFQETGYLVERLYKTAYGDASGISTVGGSHSLPVPIVRLNEFLLDSQEIAKGVIVGQPGWEQVLENNKQAFAAAFVQRTSFATAFPASMTPAQFVDALFSKAVVTPTTAQRQAAIDEFNGASTSADLAARGRSLRLVAQNPILNQLEINRAFVLMQFFGYMRRNPNDPQDPDHSGYDFWLTKLNQFNGNYITAEMVKAFLTSIEYRQRFGP